MIIDYDVMTYVWAKSCFVYEFLVFISENLFTKMQNLFASKFSCFYDLAYDIIISLNTIKRNWNPVISLWNILDPEDKKYIKGQNLPLFSFLFFSTSDFLRSRIVSKTIHIELNSDSSFFTPILYCLLNQIYLVVSSMIEW